MNLTNRPVFLKTGPEAVRKKRFNIGKYLYLTVLSGIVVLLCYAGINKLIYVSGVGQTVYQSTNLQADNDFKIIDILVNEGDDVKQGDSLLLFRYVNKDNTLQSIFEKYVMEGDLKNIEKKHLSIERDDYQEKLTQLEPFAAYSRDASEQIKSKILSCEIGIRAIDEQLHILNAKIDSLQKQKNAAPTVQVLQSPINGQIGEVFKGKDEQAFKGDVLLIMLDVNKIKINAYFDQKDMRSLQSKKKVALHFPDGTASTGRIDKFYISTKPLPVEFQKKYEPTQREITVDISPENEEEKACWKKYYKMNVNVKVRK